MAEIEGLDSYPGGLPLNDDVKEEIRLSTISPLSVDDYAFRDPVGCLNVLSEDTHLTTRTHLSLIEAVLKNLPSESRERAEACKKDIELELAQYENLGEEERTSIQKQYTDAAAVRKSILDKAKEQNAGDEDSQTWAEVGINDDSLSTDFDLTESTIERLKGQTLLAYCKVDFDQLETKWAPPFSQRELDEKNVDELSTSLESNTMRMARGDCIVASMTRTELDRAVKWLYENAQKHNQIPATLSLADFKLRFTSPESLLGENDTVIMDYYRQLHLLILPPGLRPVLEAGNHRRAALAKFRDRKLDNETKRELKDWPSDCSQPEVQLKVEQWRTWGVLILDKDKLYANPADLMAIRANPEVTHKTNSEGEQLQAIFALFETLDDETKNKLKKAGQWKHFCHVVVGVSLSKVGLRDRLRSLLANPALQPALRNWVSVLANRTPLKVYVLHALAVAKMPGFVTRIFSQQLTVFHTVFLVKNKDAVGARDVDAINSCIERVKMPTTGTLIPQYNASKLEQLFYPGITDSLANMKLPKSCGGLLVDKTVLAKTRTDPACHLPANVSLRSRNLRRRGFLTAVPNAEYDRTFRQLTGTNIGRLLPDYNFVRCFATQQLALLSRAISVVIYMFDPNKIYPFYATDEYKTGDLEADLLDSLGLGGAMPALDLATLLKPGAQERLEKEWAARQAQVPKFVNAAYNAVLRSMARAGNGDNAKTNAAVKAWLGNKRLGHCLAGSFTVDRSPVGQAEESILKTIKSTPYIMEVLKVAKDYLPFEEKAVGIGHAIALAIKPGSGIDWFGDNPQMSNFQPLAHTAAKWYAAQPRLPAP